MSFTHLNLGLVSAALSSFHFSAPFRGGGRWTAADAGGARGGELAAIDAPSAFGANHARRQYDGTDASGPLPPFWLAVNVERAVGNTDGTLRPCRPHLHIEAMSKQDRNTQFGGAPPSRNPIVSPCALFDAALAEPAARLNMNIVRVKVNSSESLPVLPVIHTTVVRRMTPFFPCARVYRGEVRSGEVRPIQRTAIWSR